MKNYFLGLFLKQKSTGFWEIFRYLRVATDRSQKGLIISKRVLNMPMDVIQELCLHHSNWLENQLRVSDAAHCLKDQFVLKTSTEYVRDVFKLCNNLQENPTTELSRVRRHFRGKWKVSSQMICM